MTVFSQIKLVLQVLRGFGSCVLGKEGGSNDLPSSAPPVCKGYPVQA